MSTLAWLLRAAVLALGGSTLVVLAAPAAADSFTPAPPAFDAQVDPSAPTGAGAVLDPDTAVPTDVGAWDARTDGGAAASDGTTTAPVRTVPLRALLSYARSAEAGLAANVLVGLAGLLAGAVTTFGVLAGLDALRSAVRRPRRARASTRSATSGRAIDAVPVGRASGQASVQASG